MRDSFFVLMMCAVITQGSPVCKSGNTYCKFIPDGRIQCGVYDTSNVTSPQPSQQAWTRPPWSTIQYRTAVRLTSQEQWVMTLTSTLPASRVRSFWFYLRFRFWEIPGQEPWNLPVTDVTVPLPMLKLEHVSSDHGISFYFKPNGQNTVVGISFYTPSTAVPLLKVFRSIGTY